MKKSRILFGLAAVALFDIGAGILISHLLAKIAGLPTSIFLYIAGIFFSLLPDLDILWQQIREGKINGYHRNSPLHWPIFTIFIVYILIGEFSSFFAAVAILCLLSHYFHDTLEGEVGIKWLAPFSEKNFSIKKKDGKISFVVKPAELRQRCLVTAQDWVRRYYVRPTFKSVIGVVFFLGSVLTALFW